jgi:hypothetical protein
MAPKYRHEFRDPVHGFIRMSTDERRVVDSRPVQRLRHVHQLATSFLVYPGATHKRFEHSLGVMELAGRVFDVITQADHIHPVIREQVPQIADPKEREYWRTVVRMAALCHDIGHLPFSHAAEHELLPEGWDHERLSAALIESGEMKELWCSMTPPTRAEDVRKIAVGPKVLGQEGFTEWEAILTEIITGDSLGVDRMDYLLRDSLHAGVAYGQFDAPRLIDSIRVLPRSDDPEESSESVLGLEEGGLHSAEGLLLARFFMFTQVYFHHVRRIYDIHLKDFLKEHLPEGRFSTEPEDHLRLTDLEILSTIREAALDPSASGHDPARRLIQREHFKRLWEWNPADVEANSDAGDVIHAAAIEEFGAESVRRDHYSKKGSGNDFPVLTSDGRIDSARNLSELLNHIPDSAIDFVFVDPNIRSKAEEWISRERAELLKAKLPSEQGDHDG